MCCLVLIVAMVYLCLFFGLVMFVIYGRLLEAWDFICKRQKHLITRQVFFHYDSVADLHALAKKFGFRVIAKDGKLTIGKKKTRTARSDLQTSPFRVPVP